MAVKLEIIKKFYSGSESKLSNVDESFHSAFENMLDLNEIISFDAVDVDDTTRTETLIFKDRASLNKFQMLFSEANSNLKSLIVESIDTDYQV